jgi:hypothetical protein
MRTSAAFLATLVLPLSAAFASAEELKSLDEAILSGSEETYPLVRCAGLYLSVLEWAGEDRLGKETSDNSKVTVANLLNLATEMRQPALGSAAEASVMRDIRAISDIYLERYQTNYASYGEAFGQDVI